MLRWPAIDARRGCMLAGVIVLLGAWFGPLPALAQTHFSAHMLLHVSVVAVAAPLLAIGLAACACRWAASAALPAALLELVVIWAWHAPALHHLARHASWGLICEQAAFLLTSLAVWWSALSTAHPAHRAQLPGGIAGLLMTSTHMTLLGVLLALAPRALYGAHTGAGDQQVGGLVMLLGGGVSYLAGALWLVHVTLRDGMRDRAHRGAGLEK